MPELTDTEAMEAMNILRSEVISTQNAGWSNTVYPLVAILDAAGYEQFEPTTDQLDEYLSGHGGTGGYPGHLIIETPEEAWMNPVDKLEHITTVTRLYVDDPSETNLGILRGVLEGIENGDN